MRLRGGLGGTTIRCCPGETLGERPRLKAVEGRGAERRLLVHPRRDLVCRGAGGGDREILKSAKGAFI